MPKKFDALVNQARGAVSKNDTATQAPDVKNQSSGRAQAPAHNSLKAVLKIVVTVCKNFGFEYLRIELAGNDAYFWAADGENKTAFICATASISEAYTANFSLGELDQLLPLLNDDSLSLELGFGDITVFKKSDPDDDESETISEIQSVVKHLVFGRCKHCAHSVSAAPKATLKKQPEWSAICQVDPKSLDQFVKHASRLKKTAKRFCGDLEGDILLFRIGNADDSNAEIIVGPCSKSDSIGNHSWTVSVFLDVIKSALLSDSMVIMISKETGLMRTDFAVETGPSSRVEFQIITPKYTP